MCIRDSNVPGFVSSNEFVQFWQGEVTSGRHTLKELSGTVEDLATELRAAKSRALCRVLDRWFAMLDTDHDGVITDQEFSAAVGMQVRVTLCEELSLIHISEPTRPY
eukprot:TRINITY_DN20329_c0_g1_i1.p1 TRINITY_DN20329_c0_g1~~TRINITY_DN20329_c0_g1_i1.p1  ORF type:complete len:107 (-),score=48.57 TRINITY_DN20329_c0_g1_i1:137-457(-)